MQVTAVHNEEYRNEEHVGTYLERTRNVLGTYSECPRKAIIQRRGWDGRGKGEGEIDYKRKRNHFTDALLVVENVPGTCCQCFRFPIEKRSQGQEN